MYLTTPTMLDIHFTVITIRNCLFLSNHGALSQISEQEIKDGLQLMKRPPTQEEVAAVVR